METSPVPMFEMPGDDQLDNKENTVRRSLVDDLNRHTPLADYQLPSKMSSPERQAASMYKFETRYQPIPTEVLPKNTNPNVYYMDSKRRGESTDINNGILERQSPASVQYEQQPIFPTAFLEPKVISQPVFYSVTGAKTAPINDEQPMSINQEPSSPTIYSITGRPHRSTVDMSVSNLEVPTSVINQSPTIYSLVSNPHFQNPIQEPTNQLLQPSTKLHSITNSPRLQNPIQEPPNQFPQKSPNLYSIIGNPVRTSRGVQVSTLDPIEPVPILYTIVDDTPPVQKDKFKQERPPKQPTDKPVYTLGSEVNTLKTQQPVSKPSLYTLVGAPNSPPYENHEKPPAKKKTSPPTTTTTSTTRRISPGSERKPEGSNEEIVSYPIIKTRRQSISKEPKNPKSETTYIPYNEQEPRSRPQPPPIRTNPEQIQRKPYIVPQNQPIQLSDYHSPYAYRTHKPYRERIYNNNPLPVVSNNNSERKSRPPLYEPRYRVEKHHQYPTVKPGSLERYPVSTKPRSFLWDNDYQTETDNDEEYEPRINSKIQSYKTARPRAPWIPVW